MYERAEPLDQPERHPYYRLTAAGGTWTFRVLGTVDWLRRVASDLDVMGQHAIAEGRVAMALIEKAKEDGLSDEDVETLRSASIASAEWAHATIGYILMMCWSDPVTGSEVQDGWPEAYQEETWGCRVAGLAMEAELAAAGWTESEMAQASTGLRVLHAGQSNVDVEATKRSLDFTVAAPMKAA